MLGRWEDQADLQTLLDGLPSGRRVACLPTQDALILYAGERELGRIPLDGIVDVSLSVDSTTQHSYPLVRTLILGPLVLLFPKRTVRETYRLCIQWKDREGEYRFTYIPTVSRIMADHMLATVKGALTPEARARAAAEALERKLRQRGENPGW